MVAPSGASQRTGTFAVAHSAGGPRPSPSKREQGSQTSGPIPGAPPEPAPPPTPPAPAPPALVEASPAGADTRSSHPHVVATTSAHPSAIRAGMPTAYQMAPQ